MATTAFEDNGGTAFTTLAEEQTFLAAVAAGSSRMSYSQIATSAGGRRIDLVVVAEPGATGAPLMVNGHMHGNEAGGREASLEFLRDLADTTDPDLVAYLSDHPVLVIPTTNPDGRVGNKRNNDNNENINRDSLTIGQSESVAVAEVLRDWQPSVLIDMHGIRDGISGTFSNLEMDTGVNPNTDATLYQACIDAVTDEVFPALDAASISNAWHLFPYGSPQILHHAAPLQGQHSFLVEANASGATAGTMRERADWSRVSIDALLEWHRINDTVVDARSLAARRRIAARAAAGAVTWAVDGRLANPRHSATTIANVTASGYSLTSVQFAAVEDALAAHGIRVYDSGDDYYVPLTGPAAGKVVALLDASSGERTVSATRLTTVPSFTGPDVLDAVAL